MFVNMQHFQDEIYVNPRCVKYSPANEIIGMRLNFAAGTLWNNIAVTSISEMSSGAASSLATR
jgi:hypothetical protein